MPKTLSQEAAKIIVYYALKLKEWETREDLIEEVENGGRN